MTDKWNKKVAIEYLTELRDPFEQTGQTTEQGKPALPKLAEVVNQTMRKNGGQEVK